MTRITAYSELDQHLGLDNKKDLKIVKDARAIETSIDNILGTDKGERCMLRQFGGALQGMLFEPMSDDMAQKIEMEVKDVINTWDDRPQILSLVVIPDYDNSVYGIDIIFRISGVGDFMYNRQIVPES